MFSRAEGPDSVAAQFRVHEAKFKRANFMKHKTEEMMLQQIERFKAHKSLKGEHLFNSLINHDTGTQLDLLQDYLNTFKPAKTTVNSESTPKR